MSVAADRVRSSPAFRRLVATRYLTALREGGSVPAVVETDDGAPHVVKFRAVALVPDDWLDGQGRDNLRAAYLTWLSVRRAALPRIIDEANRVRASRI